MGRNNIAIFTDWIPGLFLTVFKVSAAVLLGFIVHRIFFETGLAVEFGRMFVGAAHAIYGRIGIVTVGLMPLSLYLLGLAVFIVLHRLDLWTLRSSPRDRLYLVQELGPMLGVCGTMLSLSQAMGSLTMSEGVEAAINQMSSLVGQALYSSIWGVVVAMVAFLFKSFLCSTPGEEEKS